MFAKHGFASVLIKDPDYYSHSFSFLWNLIRLKCDEIFVQFVQLNEYLGNASKLLQRAPLSFVLFKRNIQNRTRPKGFSKKFSALCDFSKFFQSPFDFIEVPSRNIRSKALYSNFRRYIRTILRFCKEEAEVRKQGVFHENVLRIF